MNFLRAPSRNRRYLFTRPFAHLQEKRVPISRCVIPTTIVSRRDKSGLKNTDVVA